jgi:hypothetical protein
VKRGLLELDDVEDAAGMLLGVVAGGLVSLWQEIIVPDVAVTIQIRMRRYSAEGQI